MLFMKIFATKILSDALLFIFITIFRIYLKNALSFYRTKSTGYHKAIYYDRTATLTLIYAGKSDKKAPAQGQGKTYVRAY